MSAGGRSRSPARSRSASRRDAGLAARRALLELSEHLVATRGFHRSAAYALTSAAADLRLSDVVDTSFALVSASIPLDIFES